MKKKLALSIYGVLIAGLAAFSQSYVFQITQKGSNDWGYANLEGKVIIEPQFKFSHSFSENGAALVMPKKKWVIINVKGEVLNAEVENVQPYANPWTGVTDNFSNGYLVVRENKKWGALNPDAKIAIPIKYDRLTEFDGGYALAELEGKFFVLNKKGAAAPVQASGIKEIKHFSEGMGMIEVQGEKWGFVDANGNVAITPQFEGVGYFSGGLAWARSGGSIGFINPEGEWVIKPQFSAAKEFDHESGLAMVEKSGQWGYVDAKGSYKQFNETEKTYSFSEGLAIGRKKDKVGFLDNQGKWAIEPKFDTAREFKNGYAAVESDGKWGIIDKTGKWVVKPTFADTRDVVVVK